MTNGIPLETIGCALCDSNRCTPIAQGYDYEYWTSDQSFTMVACADCGHIYLNPRPTADSGALIYPSNYYTVSGRHQASNSQLIARMKKKVIRGRLKAFESLFDGAPNVLEIGSGDCALLLDIKERCPKASVTGVDIAFPSHIWDQRDALGLTLYQGKVEDIDLPDSTYDLVIMNQVIEHLWHPLDVLKKIASALKPGGRVSIETINTDGYDRRFFHRGTWGGYYFPRHLNLFNFDALRRLADRAGLGVDGQYSLVAPIVWTFSVHAWFCSTKAGSRGLLGRFLSDRNPLCLAAFTALDLVALLCGWTTSNQKTILVKP